MEGGFHERGRGPRKGCHEKRFCVGSTMKGDSMKGGFCERGAMKEPPPSPSGQQVGSKHPIAMFLCLHCVR